MTAEGIRAITEAMKGQPLVLALVLVNICFLALTGYIAKNVRETISAERALLAQCLSK